MIIEIIMQENIDTILIYVTASSSEEATKIGKALVERRLAACCSIIPGIQSIYRWENEVTEDAEVMLLIKTLKSAEPAIIEAVKSLHSYSVPEIISVEIHGGNEKYFQWINESVNLD